LVISGSALIAGLVFLNECRFNGRKGKGWVNHQ